MGCNKAGIVGDSYGQCRPHSGLVSKAGNNCKTKDNSGGSCAPRVKNGAACKKLLSDIIKMVQGKLEKLARRSAMNVLTLEAHSRMHALRSATVPVKST